MKDNKKIFWRTVAISSVWALCLIILISGISESYSQMRRIGFCEYKNAIEYNNGVLSILDFKL